MTTETIQDIIKSAIIAEIDRITGNLLTPAMRDEIAERATKMVNDHNRSYAMVVLEKDAANSAVLEKVQAVVVAAAVKEPNGPK